jgi:eukaryotic-like serine/threonine-protein kinase
MALQSGTKFGPYEILSLLGAGGMGEVYRARDTRLGRDVAIKILAASISASPDRLNRFEQEARTTGQLNHPNILAMYDVGSHDGTPYLVSELLEGESLRSRLEDGALPQRKAIEYAVEIARGLAAAHDKGVVHRDLKPENIFITKDDRVKILDFGLAKLMLPDSVDSQQSKLATIQPQTESGVILGTVGYMSPEQIRGKPADHRSDIFAFGSILYEMLIGKKPFRGDSAVETMNAILKEDPADMTQSNPNLPVSLEHFVRRCLEKNPDLRFHSTSDMGFALGELSGISSQSLRVRAPEEKTNWKRWLVSALIALGLCAATILIYRQVTRAQVVSEEKPWVFERLTFRRGNVLHARFAPDGKTVVYGASWEGKPTEIFVASPGSPESRPLGIQKADVLSISSDGDMAILLRSGILQGTAGSGTLAVTSLTGGGGAPREILENVYEADWLPDKSGIAVARDMNGKCRIEFPIGKVVYEGNDYLDSLRVSPDGKRLLGWQNDKLVLIDRAGKITALFPGPDQRDVACWSPDGFIYFSGAIKGRYGIYTSDISGKIQFIAPLVSHIVIHDVSKSGTVLVEQELFQQGIRVLLSGEKEERDLSWLDWSILNDFSDDGKLILINERGEAGGKKGSIYLRKTDGSPAVKLGDGHAQSLSPDGKWIIANAPDQEGRLILIPTGAGAIKTFTPEKWNCLGAAWLDVAGRNLALYCSEPGHKPRIYSLDLETQKISPISPEGALTTAVRSPEGARVLVLLNGKFAVYPETGISYPFLSSLTPQDDDFILWNQEGVYVKTHFSYPPQIIRIDAKTGKRELWKQILPSDPTIIRIDNVRLTPDTKSYAYQYARVLSSDLYLMQRSQ